MVRFREETARRWRKTRTSSSWRPARRRATTFRSSTQNYLVNSSPEERPEGSMEVALVPLRLPTTVSLRAQGSVLARTLWIGTEWCFPRYAVFIRIFFYQFYSHSQWTMHSNDFLSRMSRVYVLLGTTRKNSLEYLSPKPIDLILHGVTQNRTNMKKLPCAPQSMQILNYSSWPNRKHLKTMKYMMVDMPEGSISQLFLNCPINSGECELETQVCRPLCCDDLWWWLPLCLWCCGCHFA